MFLISHIYFTKYRIILYGVRILTVTHKKVPKKERRKSKKNNKDSFWDASLLQHYNVISLHEYNTHFGMLFMEKVFFFENSLQRVQLPPSISNQVSEKLFLTT